MHAVGLIQVSAEINSYLDADNNCFITAYNLAQSVKPCIVVEMASFAINGHQADCASVRCD
jgi:hypothetical protein